MQWYYSKAGAQHGPIPEAELRAKLAAGEVAATDLVWKDGMTDWIPSSQVEALKPSLSTLESAGAPASGRPPSPYAPPAAPAIPGAMGQRIPNYLWQSIVVTVLCCMPFGIPAIVFAAKVDGLQARGDIQGAIAASNSAKTWCWVSFGCGLAFIAIYVVAIFAGGFSSTNFN